MELLKKSINIAHKKHQLSTQVQVNEDINLPEYMQDIDKTILEKGEFLLEQVKTYVDKIVIKGTVKFCLLYVGDQNNGGISTFTKETALEEEINIDGVSEHDQVIVDASEDSFSINIINSRKINAKMLIGLAICVQEIISENIVMDVKNEEKLQTKHKTANILKMVLQNNDIFRFHNQQNIPKDKPNIGTILYENISPRELQLRCEDGNVGVEGRVHVFVLYAPETGSELPQWFDYEFPLQGKIECPESEKGMIGDLKWSISHKDIVVKDDNENEARVISADGVLDVSMNIFEDIELKYIDDIYAVDRMVYPKHRDALLPKLLMKNSSVCRLNKRMKVTDDNYSVMEICNIEADVKTEDISLEENTMFVQGHVFVRLLYMSNDDKQVLQVAKGAIPFSHNIEINGLNESDQYHIKPVIESISAAMDGVNEVEINVQIAMNVIVFQQEQARIIDDISERTLTKEELNAIPGMTGYVAGENESLWDIAKKYRTTESMLMGINKLTDEEIKAGQKLLILKNVARG